MTREEAEEFIRANPIVYMALGAAVIELLTKGKNVPKWIKDLPITNERKAGAWRGKGSFGKNFGPQTKRK